MIGEEAAGELEAPRDEVNELAAAGQEDGGAAEERGGAVCRGRGVWAHLERSGRSLSKAHHC
jgi:hypothetical protein